MNRVISHKRENRAWLLLTCLFCLLILLAGTSPVLYAAQSAQQSFPSPDEAVKALVVAVRANDVKALLSILGPESRALISSGDEAADRTGRDKFLKAFNVANTFQQESADEMTLCVGADSWPMPIPIVKKGSQWMFDVRKGKQEILNRRIGRNELHVIDILNAYVDAQHEYATKDCGRSGKVEFAQRIISSKGKHDGLFWEAKDGEQESPLGPLVAQAAKEGYANPNLQPFHGYYFKILKGQGKHAHGGAYNYVIKGRMILGFAIISYPAEYGNSGVMTFMVNQEGVIFQKNLGRNTKRLSEAMKIFDPDKTWSKAEDLKQE
ncbi:MAG: hypothetical protein H6R42_899 [Nitrospirae bacterium]|nr:hypothetical protein [Nitrospirota bacterium]